MKIKLCISLLLLVICAHAQNPNKFIRQGNNAYSDSSYTAAEESYRKALSANQDAFNAAFNLADAIYKQENYVESSALFQGLTAKAESKEEKAMAYHNLGNSLLQEEKIEESIEAYKNALRNNPSDANTKHNLAFAQRMKQQQEENKEEQQEENKEEQQEENKEEQQNGNNQEQEPQEEQKPKKEQNPDQISKEEAEKMLDALQQQEKELQEDLQKKKTKGVKLKIEKDW